MEWHHLYSPGGLEDQNPELLAHFDIIFREKGRAEKERQDQQEREMEAKRNSQGKGSVAGRRGRRR